MIPRILVSEAPIDLLAELERIEVAGAGAVASFCGRVRADPGIGGAVETLHLEHWPGVTDRALARLAETAGSRWSLDAATIVHRVGDMVPGDRIVFVGTAAGHRRAALDACAFLIDRLKTDAPFWKRERRGDANDWVEAAARDADAAARWDADGG